MKGLYKGDVLSCSFLSLSNNLPLLLPFSLNGHLVVSSAQSPPPPQHLSPVFSDISMDFPYTHGEFFINLQVHLNQFITPTQFSIQCGTGIMCTVCCGIYTYFFLFSNFLNVYIPFLNQPAEVESLEAASSSGQPLELAMKQGQFLAHVRNKKRVHSIHTQC